MSAVGGSIASVSIKGRRFPVAADADGSRKLGGFENENQMNGDGSGRLIKTRVGWSMTGLTVAIDDDRGDQEFLKNIQKRKEYVPCVIRFADGNAYQGRGQITGELTKGTNAATAELSLMGPGEMTKQ